MLLVALACVPVQPGIKGGGGSSGGDTDAETVETAETADSADSAEDTGNGDCGDIPPDEAGYTRFYDATQVHRIALTVSEAAMAELAAAPDDYVEADLVVDDLSMPSVGLKMRGDTAQQRWDGKPGFKIDLRKYDNCVPFATIERILLDAGGDDPTQAREVVSAAVLEQLDLVAPRASFATVTVNEEPFGLYTNIESIDDAFPPHHSTEPWTALWEGGDAADFTDRGLADWSSVAGSEDPAALAALSAVVLLAGDTFYTDADALIDMDQLLRVWAALVVIGHANAYPYETGDVFLYAPKSDGRLRFIPWDLDEGWDTTFRWNAVEGSLGVRCVYDPTCEAALRAHIETALTTSPDLVDIASAAFSVSADAAADDPRRGTTAGELQQARNALLTTLNGWPQRIRAQLAE